MLLAVGSKRGRPVLQNLVSLIEVIDDAESLFMVQEFCDIGPVMTEQEYNTPLPSEVARGKP